MSEMFIEDHLNSESDSENPDNGLDERLSQNTRIISFEDVDKEITEVSNLIATIKFDQRTANTSSFVRSTLMNENIEDSTFERILDINIGSSDLPRISCACHKLNIVIQSAVDGQKLLREILKKLNSYAASSRNIIQINAIFNNAKCRPKLENTTRWFSQLYLLMWAKSCYTKNCKTNFFYQIYYEYI